MFEFPNKMISPCFKMLDDIMFNNIIGKEEGWNEQPSSFYNSRLWRNETRYLAKLFLFYGVGNKYGNNWGSQPNEFNVDIEASVGNKVLGYTYTIPDYNAFEHVDDIAMSWILEADSMYYPGDEPKFMNPYNQKLAYGILCRRVEEWAKKGGLELKVDVPEEAMTFTRTYPSYGILDVTVENYNSTAVDVNGSNCVSVKTTLLDSYGNRRLVRHLITSPEELEIDWLEPILNEDVARNMDFINNLPGYSR